MSFADSADAVLSAIDALFAADDAAAIDEAHEAAIVQDSLRGKQLPEHRAAMRASLTADGIRAFELDARFAYFILPQRPHRRHTMSLLAARHASAMIRNDAELRLVTLDEAAESFLTNHGDIAAEVLESLIPEVPHHDEAIAALQSAHARDEARRGVL